MAPRRARRRRRRGQDGEDGDGNGNDDGEDAGGGTAEENEGLETKDDDEADSPVSPSLRRGQRRRHRRQAERGQDDGAEDDAEEEEEDEGEDGFEDERTRPRRARSQRRRRRRRGQQDADQEEDLQEDDAEDEEEEEEEEDFPSLIRPPPRGAKRKGKALGQFQSFSVRGSEATGDPLISEDALQVLAVDFADGTGPEFHGEDEILHATSLEQTRLGFVRSVVYVESATSNRFFKMPVQDGGEDDEQSGTRMQRAIADARRKAAERAVPVAVRLEGVIRGLFVLFQGLLAGLTLASVPIVAEIEKDDEYLHQYVSVANTTRRVFFILSTLSLVGAVDHLVKLRIDLKPMSISVTVQVICYFVAFLSTLIAAPTDARITYEDGMDERGSDWISEAEQRHDFDDALSSWASANYIRAAASLLGWISVCQLIMASHQLS